MTCYSLFILCLWWHQSCLIHQFNKDCLKYINIFRYSSNMATSLFNFTRTQLSIYYWDAKNMSNSTTYFKCRPFFRQNSSLINKLSFEKCDFCTSPVIIKCISNIKMQRHPMSFSLHIHTLYQQQVSCVRSFLSLIWTRCHTKTTVSFLHCCFFNLKQNKTNNFYNIWLYCWARAFMSGCCEVSFLTSSRGAAQGRGSGTAPGPRPALAGRRGPSGPGPPPAASWADASSPAGGARRQRERERGERTRERERDRSWCIWSVFIPSIFLHVSFVRSSRSDEILCLGGLSELIHLSHLASSLPSILPYHSLFLILLLSVCGSSLLFFTSSPPPHAPSFIRFREIDECTGGVTKRFGPF